MTVCQGVGSVQRARQAESAVMRRLYYHINDNDVSDWIGRKRICSKAEH